MSLFFYLMTKLMGCVYIGNRNLLHNIQIRSYVIIITDLLNISVVLGDTSSTNEIINHSTRQKYDTSRKLKKQKTTHLVSASNITLVWVGPHLYYLLIQERIHFLWGLYGIIKAGCLNMHSQCHDSQSIRLCCQLSIFASPNKIVYYSIMQFFSQNTHCNTLRPEKNPILMTITFALRMLNFILTIIW